jgi:hypothetical protein
MKTPRPLNYVESCNKIILLNKEITFTGVKNNIVKLKIEGERKVLTTTVEHPFYVKIKRQYRIRSSLETVAEREGDWKTSGELKFEDKVRRPDGS